MDKASGVYYSLTDNSIKVSGSTEMEAIVVGISRKGSLKKLNKVTAQTLESVLGYDLGYNPNLLGLKQILETVSFVQFLRINKNAACANIVLNDDNTLTSIQNIEDCEELKTLEKPIIISHTDAGDWGPRAFKLEPYLQREQITIEDVGEEITIEEVLCTERQWVEKETGIWEYEGIQFYTPDGTFKIAATRVEAATAPASFPASVDIFGVDSTGAYTQKIGVLTKDTDNQIVLSFSQIPSHASLQVAFVNAALNEWDLSYARKTSNGYVKLDSFTFSRREGDANHLKFVDTKDLSVFGEWDFTNLSSIQRICDIWVDLTSGDNGTAPTSAADLNFEPLKKSTANMLAMNGVTDLPIVNAFLAQCDKDLRTCFVDAPAFQTYEETAAWVSRLFRTEYGAVGARPDTQEVEGIGTVYLWPSINYLFIYANMLANYNTLNYPPAGHPYGDIIANALLETDFADYGDHLKTNRINHQKATSLGACLWEDRTLYSQNSDLSYINTVFILRDFRRAIMSIMENYNFHYTTAQQLLTIESNLKDVLDSYKSNGWFSQTQLHVPSFAEAQKMGRNTKISIGVAVTQDGQVYEIDVVLENYSN